MQARELDRCEQILVRNSRSCCGTEMDNQVGHRRTVGEPRRERQGDRFLPRLDARDDKCRPLARLLGPKHRVGA